MSYWLFKSEPREFGLDHLLALPGRVARWDGVRNYEARNLLRDHVQMGDSVFLYHSSCAQPGIVGLMEVVRAGYPDPTAFDPQSPYWDPRSLPSQPRWYAVDIRLTARLNPVLTLSQLRQDPGLHEFRLLRRGNRLSILPVTSPEWIHLLTRTHLHPL
jgi:predicted RNA-binding protein with PUA-like domain